MGEPPEHRTARPVKERVANTLRNGGLVAAALLMTLGALELAFRWREPRLDALPNVVPRATPATSAFTLLGIGESSMLAEPYDARLDFLTLVGLELQQGRPDLQIEKRLVASKGASLGALFPDALAAIAERPSAVVVFAGHNEFFAEVSGSEACSEQGDGLYGLLGGSAVFRFVHARLLRHGIGQIPDAGDRAFFDRPVVCKPKWDAMLERYAALVFALARACHDAAVPAVLIFPAGNQADFGPNRSVSRASPAARTEIEARYRRAVRAMYQGGLDEAARDLDQTIALDSDFAAARFSRGRVAVAAEEADAARGHFSVASEQDGYPWRALDGQAAALRAAAGRYDADFIDARAVLSEASSTGLLDSGVFHDIHHPTLPGYLALARAVAERLEKRTPRGLGPQTTERRSISADDVLRDANFSIGDAFQLFLSRVRWLDRSTTVTFDPTMRLLLLLDNIRALQTLDASSASDVVPPEYEQGVRERLTAALDRYGAGEHLDDLLASRIPLLDRHPHLRREDRSPVHIGSVPSFIRHGQSNIVDGRGADGRRLQVRGEVHEHGFVAVPPSDVGFVLARRYARLEVGLVIADSGTPKASARCRVLGDGRTLSSLELTYDDPVTQLDLDVADVHELRLRCDDADDGNDGDHVAWLSPRLTELNAEAAPSGD
jgi:hypothetical protein